MHQNIMMSLVVVSILISCQPNQSKTSLTKNIQRDSISEVDILKQDTISTKWTTIDFKKQHLLNKMVYADTANFMHQKVYPCAVCLLRPEVADALVNASAIAQQQRLQLVIYDCYRPKSLQQKMYDIVQNPKYVALPSKGSNHNKGCAIDVGLADSSGKELDLGTAFDDFSEKAYYASDLISDKSKNNRKILREIMQKAGFKPYNNEWWHFNFSNCNYPVSDDTWPCQ
mgnify:CR=1 FL=1